MIQTWQLEAPSRTQLLPADAVARLLDVGSATEPAAAMLDFLGAVAPVDYLTLVEYVPPGRSAPAEPVQAEGHATPRLRNVTYECFAHYRQRFWRDDPATRIAHQLGRGDAPAMPVAALHVQADDIPDAGWRAEIYERALLSARLSLLYAPLPGSAWAINLYRHRSSGPFGPDEIDRVLAVAPLLRQVHAGTLHAGAAAPAALPARVARAQAALRRQAPELSPREQAVCARIACGMGLDGIAAELDVAPSTVATWRKRAYAKLAVRGLSGGRMQLARLLTH